MPERKRDECETHTCEDYAECLTWLRKKTHRCAMSVCASSWSFAVKPQTFWSCKVACQLPEVKCQKYGVGWRWTGNVQKKKKYKMANPRNDKVPGIVPRLFNQNDVRNAVFYSFPMSPCFSQSQSAQTPIEASAWRRSRKRTTHAPETEKVFGDLGFKHLCLVLKLYGISKSTYPMMNLK